MVDENRAIELYQALECCKEGSCSPCGRNDRKSSNTYPCRKQLLQDCFDWFDEYLDND